MFQCDIDRKVDWTWRATWMVYLVAGCKSERLLPVGTGEDAHLGAMSQGHWTSHGRTSGSCDNGQCQSIKAYIGEWHEAHCHPTWNGGWPLWTPSVTASYPWFDHLIPCTVWGTLVSWKLNISGHILCDIFNLLFNKESHYGECVVILFHPVYLMCTANILQQWYTAYIRCNVYMKPLM